MANEITIRESIRVKNGNQHYQNQLTAWQTDMAAIGGPTPGMLTIPTGGKVIDLGELDEPGECIIENYDATNYIEYGLWDADTDVFYPLGEVLPGTSVRLRLSRNIREAYESTGTGTTGPSKFFFAKANTSPCKVFIGAFEA